MNDIPRILANLSPQEKRTLLAELLRKRANEPEEEFPLSHGQRSLWFLYQLAPESAAYNLIYSAHIRSRVDIPALERAAQTLLNRHPILTATYTIRNGEPVQRLHPHQKVHFEVVDASDWSEEQLKQHLFAEGERPFDLEQGPVLRIQLLTRSVQNYVLLLTVHHIAIDFLALDSLLDELCIVYAAEKVGLPAPLSPPDMQYSDYIRWQADMLAGAEGERLWTYWRQELAGELPVLNLPTDRPRPPVQTYRGASHSFKLSEELTRRLKTLANAEKATLYMIMLSAFQTLLFRYTNQEDIQVGTPTLGRSQAHLQRVIGHLVNPVVLRANFSGNPSFKELLSRVRRTVIGALEHQDFPFPLLVQRLQPKRDASYPPLLQVMFIWDKPRQVENVEVSLTNTQIRRFEGEIAPRIAQERLKLEPFIFGQQGAPFDLTLTVFEVAGSLSADFRYNVDLFDGTTLTRMEKHLQVLLESIVANPEQRVLDFPLLTAAEQHQLLVEWNATKSHYPEHMGIHQIIESQVQQTPEAVAVVFEDQQLTYNELNRQANQLAHALQASGVGPDVLVGICMERSLEMVVALLAVLKAGGAYVPLDPAYPRQRLNYMIQDARMPVLLSQQRLLERLPSHEGLEIIFLDADWQTNSAVGKFRAFAHENPVSNVEPDNLVYMIYTSGSTGKPKGVMNIHRGLCNRLHWMQQTYQLTPVDRVLQKTPFSFDVSVWEFFWPLLAGACLVVARPGGHQDPGYLVSLIAEQKITTLHFVPSMLQAFLNVGIEGTPAAIARCESLKRVICSGEALSVELQERFFSCLNAELDNLYGPTEASIDVTYWKCQRQSPQWTVPIGYPIANTQIYILDQALHPVPVGLPGELYIGGVGVARGYFNRPELTAEKFVPNPFSKEAGARLFKTGDLARYRPDGAIEFLGRIDYQAKIRGFRIEPGEIETVLGQHPAIKAVVVVTREDIPGEKRLVAYLVSEADLSIEHLRTFLSEKIPYYMVPAAFVFLDALPLTSNGKVDRKALPAPETTRPRLEETYVPPRNAIEVLLAKIWAEVLGIDRVGIHDNYFDSGGASIQSLQIMTKANEAGLQLTPEMLFEYQTVAELAAVAAAHQSPDGAEQFPATVSRFVDDVDNPEEVFQNEGEQFTEFMTARGNTIIESMGVYLPPKVVSTQEILQNCTTPIRFPLEQLTGINIRRMAGEREFSFDLAKKAVENCLANSKYSPEDIDLLICGNISRYDGPNARCTFEPSTSIRLQQHFGFANALVFDISNACTGLFTAVYIVDAFLKAGLIRRGMVVSGEYITHLTQTAQKEIEGYMDSRLACLTLGDAGAAIILESSSSKQVGFHELELYTVSHYHDLCIAKATDKAHGGAIMFTDAVRVSAVNMQQAVPFAASMLKRFGWSDDTVQHVIMHQTSKTTINDAARAINSYFGKEVCHNGNVINNIAERGNTATTTQIVALMDHILANTIRSGDNIVFAITGSGATIGAALYTLDDLPDRLRRIASGAWKPDKVKPNLRKPISLLPPNQRVRVESIGTLPKDMEVKRATLELARLASENCLATSSYSRKDIDLLVYSGVYRDDFICEPAIASMVAGVLKINDTIESPEEKKTLAFDLFNGALGFLNACYASIGMIRAKTVKNVMVVASEIENNRDILPAELRGVEETASAVILDESPDGNRGFGNFVFKYFTNHIEACAAYTVHRNGKTCMHVAKDPHIESYYLQCIPVTVHELLSIEGLDISQIKVILPPQISSSFIAELSDRLNLSRDKFVDDVAHESRDLFTSSIPYALQYVRQRQLVEAGDVGLIISVGSGIQVGCAIYYF